MRRTASEGTRDGKDRTDGRCAKYRKDERGERERRSRSREERDREPRRNNHRRQRDERLERSARPMRRERPVRPEWMEVEGDRLLPTNDKTKPFLLVPTPLPESYKGDVYQCKDCPCKYKAAKQLVHHRLQTHDSKMECFSCHKVYTCFAGLTAHMAFRHPDEKVTCVYCKSVWRPCARMLSADWETFRSHLYGELVYANLAEMEEERNNEKAAGDQSSTYKDDLW